MRITIKPWFSEWYWLLDDFSLFLLLKCSYFYCVPFAFLKPYTLGDSGFFRLQGIKVLWRLQFWEYLRTLSLKFQKALTKIEVVLSLPCWSEPSEILNVRSSSTLEPVAFTIPWYIEVWKILNHLMYIQQQKKILSASKSLFHNNYTVAIIGLSIKLYLFV